MNEGLPASSSSPGPAVPVRSRGAWSRFWRSWYRLLRLFERPLVRLVATRGLGNLVLLRVPGRRSRRTRTVPLGLLTVGGRRYLGHPSGDSGWTLDVRACERALMVRAGRPATPVRASLLPPGVERDDVVRASFTQHPFPGNALYRLAGRHVAAYGVFFRLEEIGSTADAPARRTDGA